MEVNDVVIRELTRDEIANGTPFAHFGWEGSDALSLEIISDGYWDCAKLLLEKMKKESNDIAVVDSLVYPLFFNYRHSVELYLKAMFFSLGEQTDGARKHYLELGHDLQKLWKNIKLYLNKGIEHVGSSVSTVSTDAVEQYINAIGQFDPDSMIMRYPIKKSLVANKNKEFHFDFVSFGIRMNDLCDSLRILNYDLSNQMKGEALDEELETYIEVVEKYHEQIAKFMSILEEESHADSKDFGLNEFVLNLSVLTPSLSFSFLKRCDDDLLILLDNMFYAGRTMNSHEVRLAKDLCIKRKEFVKLCYDLMARDNLNFGEKPRVEQINIWGKQPSAILSAISTSLSILEIKVN